MVKCGEDSRERRSRPQLEWICRTTACFHKGNQRIFRMDGEAGLLFRRTSQPGHETDVPDQQDSGPVSGNNGAMMRCRIHPEREALAVCQKHEAGFCRDCCECLNIDQCCECLDPKLYCKFRSQCIIWEMSRDRRKKDVEPNF